MVEKEILEAGLGNVHIAQFSSGGEGEVGNFGNQGASAVGVEIGAVAIGGAHFGDAGQSFQACEDVVDELPKRRRSR